jgi:UPF0755 protein
LTLLLVLLACVDPDAPMDASDTTEFVFEVPKGATASKLGPALVEQGLVKSETSWKLYGKSHDLGCLKAGKFRVSRSMSLNELRDTLCGVPLAEDVPFTVVEGWRIRDIDAALAEKGLIQPGDYATLAESKAVTLPFEITSPTLEGYLYPETYMVTPDRFTAKAFIERQLATFNEKFLSKHGPSCEKRTLHGIVVMASMLEREEPDPANRRVVAGVLWKRIDHDWNLGVDATSRYTLADWNDRKAFLGKLRDPDDPYNSRLRAGLPPTAIGNPSIVSLEAALDPVDSEWWYYLHDGERKFHGARNADEHEANRRKYDVW